MIWIIMSICALAAVAACWDLSAVEPQTASAAARAEITGMIEAMSPEERSALAGLLQQEGEAGTMSGSAHDMLYAALVEWGLAAAAPEPAMEDRHSYALTAEGKDALAAWMPGLLGPDPISQATRH